MIHCVIYIKPDMLNKNATKPNSVIKVLFLINILSYYIDPVY